MIPTHLEGPLHAESHGAGPPMLLLHALPMDRTCWVYQVARFATWFRVVTVDLPGLGSSPHATPGLTMTDLAQAAWDAIDRESRDPAIVVGLSIGSGVAKYMAHLRPARVRALVLSGGGYHADPSGAMIAKGILARHQGGYEREGIAYRRTQLARNFSDAFRASPLFDYFVDQLTERDASADAASIVLLLRAHDGPDPTGLHGGIRAPTLVISGGEDRSLREQQELARRIPGAELVVVPGAGHCVNLERPWAYDAAVLEFLRRRGLAPR